jgi:DNA-binding MarR family transcriptional regulator
MNTTKIEILRCLSDGDWWTTPEVAQECGLSLTNTSELLRRYRSQSLVNRQRNYDVPRGYLYRITNIGIERLEYLCSDEIKTSQVLAEEAGLTGTKKRVFDSWVKQKLGR